VSDIISDMKSAIALPGVSRKIPDIIEFCNSKDYLGLPHLRSPIHLKPVQILILKVFYRGSRGNEDIKLTEEELSLCKNLGLVDPERGNVLDKYYNQVVFRELVLVWGRRASKDFVSSIIALYEAMKLLEAPGGDPYGYYNIAADNPITVLTVANSSGQAEVAFNEIRGKLLSSSYFNDKYVKEGLSHDSICLLTPKDKEENREFIERDMGLKTRGSIIVEVGHSNSATLLGKKCFVLILDEVASYKTSGGSASADRIYSALTPTIADFFREEVVLDKNGKTKLDENGKTVNNIVYDGKIISISSPRAKEGKLWDLFSQADLYDSRLACRLPTWDVMPERTRASLKKEFKTMNEEEFEMEFGAEFSGIAGENFFSEEHVKRCFKGNIQFRKMGEPGQIYFLHLDPAATSHNYALALVHKQIFLNEETHKADYMIMVDLLKYWHPTINKPVIASEVDEYVIKLKRLFRIGMVTYDAWNCPSVDSYIYTKRGLIRAGDIKIGDQLYSKEGLLNSVVSKDIAVEIDGFEIITKFGYSLSMNSIHPVLTKNAAFVQAKNLKVGDEIMLKDFSYEFGEIDEPDRASYMGYLVSEGNLVTHRNRYHSVQFTNTDRQVIDDFKVLATSACGEEPKESMRWKDHERWKDAWLLSYHKGEICSQTIEWGFVAGSHNKSVPQFVMQGNRNTVSAFLATLFEGDGTMAEDSHSRRAMSVQYDTVSAELAEQVHLLLLGFGIKSSIKYYRNKFFNGRRCPFYHLAIYGNNILTFAREIGFRSDTKCAKLKKIVLLQKQCCKRQKSRSQYMYDRIISIKPVKIDIAHIEADGDHTYVTNGIISHNSLESKLRLRKAGMPNKETRFTNRYKMVIYAELLQLVNAGKLIVPNNDPAAVLLMDEMIALQKKIIPTGYRISAKRSGDGVKTDDLVDSLAGACYSAINMNANMLPQVKLVDMGVSPQSNERVWQGMQGPIGTGTGKQVADALSSRQPWRNPVMR
tara:strand:+ start:11432 stop:14389 length:2958 start_codon:yes stop_codon:yes gene_type:complete